MSVISVWKLGGKVCRFFYFEIKKKNVSYKLGRATWKASPPPFNHDSLAFIPSTLVPRRAAQSWVGSSSCCSSCFEGLEQPAGQSSRWNKTKELWSVVLCSCIINVSRLLSLSPVVRANSLASFYLLNEVHSCWSVLRIYIYPELNVMVFVFF